MTQIVQLVLASTDRHIAGVGLKYPQQPPDELLNLEMAALRSLSTALSSASWQPDFEAVERRAAPLTEKAGTDLLAAIQHDLRPATVDDIRGQVALLIECRREFRDLERNDVFWVQMKDRVGALRPSVGALKYAFKRLINEPRPEFKPRTEISDVLEMVKSEQYLRERAFALMAEIPCAIEERRTKLDQEATKQADRREREKALIRSILSRPPSEDPLATGPHLSDCDQGLVDEVRQELGLVQ